MSSGVDFDMDVLPPLHSALLAAFILVTMLLLATSSAGLKRAEDVVLFWRDVRVQPLPIGPIVFLCLMVVLLIGVPLLDLGIPAILPVGYFFGGLLWLLASLLTPAAVITHHGLIARTRGRRQRVAWRQITDYFRFEKRGRSGVVFLYIDRNGDRRRLELTIPRRHADQFERILDDYVTGRLDTLPEEAFRDTRPSS